MNKNYVKTRRKRLDFIKVNNIFKRKVSILFYYIYENKKIGVIMNNGFEYSNPQDVI